MSGAVDRDIEAFLCAFFCCALGGPFDLDTCEEAAEEGRGGKEAGTKSSAPALR